MDGIDWGSYAINKEAACSSNKLVSTKAHLVTTKTVTFSVTGFTASSHTVQYLH